MKNEDWNIEIEDHEEFRDTISTVDKEGKRVWLYPKKPKGSFYNARMWVSLIFLILFLSVPFIKIDGEQFLLFNVLERKFVLFGLVFTPQDFHLFGLAMLTFIVFIILFTVVFGRLFCGWVCPQTVFMEMFFRRIEYWIEGDAGEQRKLDKSRWTAEKIRKKATKHIIFYLISFVAANFFLAYIIGMDEVIKIVREPVSQHIGGFFAILVFSGLFYGVFARLREQVCTTICPYGRLQGVLLVKDTIVVAYDHKRGEPRGKRKKSASDGGLAEFTTAHDNPVASIQNAVGGATATKAAPALGDCVDCGLCVRVCPTGIDIRNGTQLECTNCTACIDACDEIMDKVGSPRKLIRYDSMTGIESGIRKIFTTRVLAYTFALSALLVLDVLLIANRGSIETIILRAPGQLYQEKDSTHITNLYTFILINKTSKEMPVELHATSTGAKIQIVGNSPGAIPKNSKIEGSFFIEMPLEDLPHRKTPISIEILSNGEKIDEVTTNFLGPNK